MTTKKTETAELETWDAINMAVSATRRLLLWGPPGTGKTHVAKNAPNESGATPDVFNITLTEDTPAAELRGHFIPKGNEFVWMDGPAIKAWRTGSRLVINEIDRGSGDALTFLYALLDDPDFATITLPTGETVKPGEGFHAVATMNGQPEDLPEALQDRFPVTILVNEVAPAAILSLPEDLREIAASLVVADDERRVGLRQWIEFATLRTKLGEENAAQLVLGPKWQSIVWNMKV